VPLWRRRSTEDFSAESRHTLWLDRITRDLVYAFRGLRKSPGFTIVAILMLSAGIGSVTTIFSFVNAVFFHPLPYRDADRIVALTEIRADRVVQFSSISPAAIAEIRRSTRSFDKLATYRTSSGILSSGGDPVDLETIAVDSALIPMLGLRPERGRLFAPDDYTAGASPVLLSDEMWRHRFGADDHLIGTPIRIDRALHTVIGIVRAGQRFPERTDLWFPLPPGLSQPDSDAERSLSAIGRLRAGESPTAAQTHLTSVAQSLAAVDSQRFGGEKLWVEPGMVEMRGRNPFVSRVFWQVAGIFVAGAACVLLIVCANVGALLLVRGAERRREMAIRASLGATRMRLIQQNLTESLLLALAAAVAGAILAALGVKAVTVALPLDNLPSWLQFGIDARVLLFTLAVALCVTVGFGLMPAREATRIDLVRALKAGGDTTVAGGAVTRGARNRVVVELALAFVLVVTAASGWGTYRKLAAVNLGFERDRIMTGDLTLPDQQYPDGRSHMRFGTEASDELAASPAVAAAAFSTQFFQLRSDPDTSGQIDGRLYSPADPGRALNARTYINEQIVSAGYFRAIGLTLHEGRWFDTADDSSSGAAVIVSERLAHILAPSGPILGLTFQMGARKRPVTVIGVVSNIVEIEAGDPGHDGTEPQAAMYFSDRQAVGMGFIALIVRAKGPTSTLTRVIPAAVHHVDPDVPVEPLRPMEAESEDSLLLLRITGGVMGAFALAALCLAVLGTYGIIAYDVSQRTREIGIRIALGGSTTTIMRWIIARGVRFTAAGLALGVCLAALTSRLVGSLLFGYQPASAAVYTIVLALFAGVGLAACYLPARRVTRADPMGALRSE
jgi:putative ABC transport system permease protein